MAHTEIFILNYNGAQFLPECLSSLARLELGPHSATVSVVDNNSSDDSAVIAVKYPTVNFIQLDANYGFSKGNNLGVRRRLQRLKQEGRAADFVCFLNNDTLVDRLWLQAALDRFETDPRIGVVGSKACFYDRFVEVAFECSASFCPADRGEADSRPLGVYLSPTTSLANVRPNPKRSKWLDAYPLEPCGGRWLKPKGRFLLAVEDDARPVTLSLALENRNPQREPMKVTMTVGGHGYSVSIPSGETRTLQIETPSDTAEYFIQNAGSFVTPAWDGGDVGTFIPDRGNFEEAREVAAVCGVSLFMRAALFEKLGGFDEAYFAYFEDTDLSLRARMAGYTCWYEPRSRLRHVHCGSGGEFSPYFNYNVTHSHILFTSRWMAALPFWRKFYWMTRWAWRELKVFAEDGDLDTKPNLKTFIQFVRHPFRIPSNRLFRLRRFHTIKRLPRK